MINKGRLSEYIKGGKWDGEESLETKSRTKVSEAGPTVKKRETDKGKCSYIAVIFVDTP